MILLMASPEQVAKFQGALVEAALISGFVAFALTIWAIVRLARHLRNDAVRPNLGLVVEWITHGAGLLQVGWWWAYTRHWSDRLATGTNGGTPWMSVEHFRLTVIALGLVFSVVFLLGTATLAVIDGSGSKKGGIGLSVGTKNQEMGWGRFAGSLMLLFLFAIAVLLTAGFVWNLLWAMFPQFMQTIIDGLFWLAIGAAIMVVLYVLNDIVDAEHTAQAPSGPSPLLEPPPPPPPQAAVARAPIVYTPQKPYTPPPHAGRQPKDVSGDFTPIDKNK